jgi:diguanylate cyclase (GGDEF)-like protein/PAS domain S-box-containing protein
VPDPSTAIAHAAAIDKVTTGVAIVGRDGRLTEVNPALCRILDRERLDLVGRHLCDLVRPAHRDATWRWIDKWNQGSVPPFRAETWTELDAESPRRIVIEGSAALDERGTVEALVITVDDITDSPRSLSASEHRWRALMRNVSDTVTVIDANGIILSTTGEVNTILGYPPDFWIGHHISDTVHPEDLAKIDDVMARLLADPGSPVTSEVRIRHSDGSWAEIWVHAANLLSDPDVGGIVLTTRNITGPKRASLLVTSQTRILELIAGGAPLDDVLDAIGAMIEDHDPGSLATVLLRDGTRLRPRSSPHRGPSAAIRAALSNFDVTEKMEELFVGEHGVPTVVQDFSEWRNPLADQFRAEGIGSMWWASIRPHEGSRSVGSVLALHRGHHTPTDHTRRVADVACTLVAVALERHSTAAELAHRSLHDDLTGLPNRSLLLDRLQTGLDRIHRMGDELAVLFVDLDLFKRVNDSLGHHAGDDVLRTVADRLRAVIRPGDTVARVGADEFVIVCDRPGSLSTILSVADRLNESMKDPIRVGDDDVFLTVSLGLALSTPGIDALSLLRNADAAMLGAKQRGRDRLEMYDSAMQATALDRLTLGSDLRRAVDRDELHVVYQPIVDLETGTVTGAEALLRWRHPTRGEVPPAAFIPVAEETGIIVDIGAWVLETALDELASIHPSALHPFALSVNLSARQLDDPTLLDRVTTALQSHDWPAEQLCLELTETAMTEDLDVALRVLVRLRTTGTKIAVDDFGTGFSSLTHLQRLPIDTIKIDRSFVQGLGEGGASDRSTIATAVLNIARVMGLEAVAEGVETTAQLSALRELGCAQGQGYLFSVPVPADVLLDMTSA